MNDDPEGEARERLASALGLREEATRAANKLAEQARGPVIDGIVDAIGEAAERLDANRGETAVALCLYLGAQMADRRGLDPIDDPEATRRTAVLVTLIARAHNLHLIANATAQGNA